MKIKHRIMVAVSDDVHKKMREIKNKTERSYMWILTRAVNNYWQATIGNSLKNPLDK